MRRRQVLGAGMALAAAGCAPAAAVPPATWVGASAARGHRLRTADALPAPAVQRRAGAVVIGGGIAGLAAARAFTQRGEPDVQVLELEDSVGGNSRGHAMAGLACPLGAHYLPLPGPQAHEVSDWLHEIGLLKSAFGRTVANERHLCHSPQERLFIDGAWVEGLLPPADPASATARQYRRFAAAVAALARTPAGERAFALPAHRAPWGAQAQALDSVTFDTWLAQQGLDDARLRWYLDYCCHDDYGAGTATVSAWAGLHYFASRHGFHAPDPNQDASESEREPVFTWPEGNAWLVQRLAAPLAGRIHTGRTVLRVTEARHQVQVLAWDEAGARVEAWTAPQVVLALPLVVAARIVESPPQALRDAAARLSYAPWLVANLQLSAPLLARPGAPPSWDNVVYGSRSLGYVDALHQSLRPDTQATLITAYHALPASARAALLAADPAPWRERVLADLAAVHPDIRQRVQRIDLMRWGHAMAIPRPGTQRHPALLALRALRGRVRCAHADLAGYSVFEEAFTAGCEVVLPTIIT